MIGTWGNYSDAASIAKKSLNISSYKNIYRTDDVYKADNSYFQTSSSTSFTGDAYQEAAATPVEPRSLFKAQLALRTSGDYRNVRPNAPVLVTPRAEETIENSSMYLTGLYQKGASKVTVYIDDTAYTASLQSTDNTFSLAVPILADGWHKIYVTQTINSIEGTKSADRFVKTGTSSNNSNPSYLNSSYPRQKTALITNDTRPMFQ